MEHDESEERLFDLASRAHELAILMQGYYSTKNRGRIGARLIAAARVLIDKMDALHDGHRFYDFEKRSLSGLKDRLKELEEQDQALRREADDIATQIARTSWKLSRMNRPENDVRRELAGISKKIEALLKDE